MKRYLPDVNVWFALALEEHRHYACAREWWEAMTGLFGFLTITKIGLLRLLTTAAAMNGKPLTNQEAWQVYTRFEADSRIRRFADLPAADAVFRELSDLPAAAPKTWVDAYIAAAAVANEAQLVTFDQAMARYPVDCLILEQKP